MKTEHETAEDRARQRERVDASVREAAHERLDEIFDLYASGAPLWLSGSVSWVTPQASDRLEIVIREGVV